jgi:hypothetical protein
MLFPPVGQKVGAVAAAKDVAYHKGGKAVYNNPCPVDNAGVVAAFYFKVGIFSFYKVHRLLRFVN